MERMPETLLLTSAASCAQAKEDKAVPRELWEERAGLMKELGWDHWENLATTSLVRSVQNPPHVLCARPRLLVSVRTA